MSFRDEITIESALESSESILKKKNQEVKAEIWFHIKECSKMNFFAAIFKKNQSQVYMREVKVGMYFSRLFGGL